MGFIYHLSEHGTHGGKKAPDFKKWFADDVLRKGVKQIGRTRDLLRTYISVSLVNARGHRVMVPMTAVDDLVALIVYRASSKASGFTPARFSETRAGFVHIMRDTDYFGICEYLVTPSELTGYLGFRREVLSTTGFLLMATRFMLPAANVVSSVISDAGSRQREA